MPTSAHIYGIAMLAKIRIDPLFPVRCSESLSDDDSASKASKHPAAMRLIKEWALTRFGFAHNWWSGRACLWRSGDNQG